jgi:hypothetical protein
MCNTVGNLDRTKVHAMSNRIIESPKILQIYARAICSSCGRIILLLLLSMTTVKRIHVPLGSSSDGLSEKYGLIQPHAADAIVCLLKKCLQRV